MLKNLKLLYVEDEIVSNELICDLLQPFVQEIKGVVDPLEALKVYEEYNPDIVLTDLRMPNIDGFELIRQIKLKNPKQHFIVVSAFSDVSNFQNAIKLQISGYILKPVEERELLSEIKRVATIVNQEKLLEEKDAMILTQSRQAAMGELIGMIAHQWKQPLNTISVTVSSLMVKADFNEQITNEDMDHHGHIIMDQVNYLANTIDEFRDFLKPNKQKERVFVSNIIQDTLRIVGKSLQNNEITIELDISEEFEIETFRKEFVQVLLNILNNAKDAFNGKGIENKKVLIRTNKIGDNFVISISDNAGGIDLAYKDTLFDPYVSSKDPDKGTGIGLYMVKTLVEKHFNGTVKAFNDNDGAVFQITLKI